MKLFKLGKNVLSLLNAPHTNCYRGKQFETMSNLATVGSNSIQNFI